MEVILVSISWKVFFLLRKLCKPPSFSCSDHSLLFLIESCEIFIQIQLPSCIIKISGVCLLFPYQLWYYLCVLMLIFAPQWYLFFVWFLYIEVDIKKNKDPLKHILGLQKNWTTKISTFLFRVFFKYVNKLLTLLRR